MAILKSAKKAIRAAARRKIFNDRRRRALREALKKIETFAKQGSYDEAAKFLSTAYKAIDKAAKRGVIPPNTAARRKSRVARMAKAPATLGVRG